MYRQSAVEIDAPESTVRSQRMDHARHECPIRGSHLLASSSATTDTVFCIRFPHGST